MWNAAMENEIKALEKNNKWEVVPLHKGKKDIRYKRILKVKMKKDGY